MRLSLISIHGRIQQLCGSIAHDICPRAVTSQAKITILAKDEGTLLNAGERRNLLTVLSGFILMMLSGCDHQVEPTQTQR
jgi:hypothetical protein